MTEQTITSYFEEDHNKLDQMFDQFQTLKACNYIEAKQYFKDFKSGLQRHIIWEEEILFPIFEAKMSMGTAGPTAIMRTDHRIIKNILEKIHEKVLLGNPESDDEEAELLNFLAQHNLKEEQVLYPLIDQFISKEERDQIFRQMENLPQERYRSCCGLNPPLASQ